MPPNVIAQLQHDAERALLTSALVSLLLIALMFFALYWVVRLAVRHALQDTQAEAPSRRAEVARVRPSVAPADVGTRPTELDSAPGRREWRGP